MIDPTEATGWVRWPLSPFDDLPCHQLAEPVRHVGTSDRNFYDRYYFNCHNCSDELFLVMGMGQYPNLSVTDAFALVLHDGQHRVVRASRELGTDRSETAVGPFRIEVIEGLRRLRTVLEPNEWNLAFDLTWDAAIPATFEPRHLDRQLARVVFDSARFAQLGRWSGRIEVDGSAFEVTPDRWMGSRDRSWGVRPVGEAEPPGIASAAPFGGFFWLYCPVLFEDHAVLVIAQERSDERRVIEEGIRVWADPQREPELLGSPRHTLRYHSGTRVAAGGTIELSEPDGTPLVIEATSLLPAHIGVGTGYGMDADWRHGMYQGPSVVQGLVHDLRTEAGRAAMWGIVDAVGRFEITEGRAAGQIGYGLFEHMLLGPYARYGFRDFLDGAP